ncbi:MAG: UbiH/UbiF/VisC/COQ6 family ubiquinone biosynthesis hydroxylase [Gammaproteobacteria bacterium]|nr:UbiH/UbiF/VisC/COQ6 family ubiquinone biosynthesis hydroxylase [Gammaproteobacteria bacterium]
MHRSRASQYDALVLGGGVVGLALAGALAQGGLKVGVVDKELIEAGWSEDSRDLRVSAITRASQRLFARLGAWEAMAALRLSPYQRMRVWDAAGGGEIGFSAAEIGEPDLGHIVENRVLRLGLYQACQRLGVDWLSPAAAERLERGGELARLSLDDGRVLKARLVVGADGARSWLREAAGIDHRESDYGHHGLVATIRTEHAHEHTAWQRFQSDGVLAFLPLSDPNLCSIVWSVPPERAAELKTLDSDGFNKELGHAFEHRLGRVELTGPRASFPLTMRHAARYIAERVALAGDAAHTIHPLAGQGVNLGLMDAASLAEVVLKAHAMGRDIGLETSLRPYERWRRGENTAMLAAMDGFKALFGSSLFPLQLARNIGLSLFDKAAPLKALAIKRAMGLTGDLPELAR